MVDAWEEQKASPSLRMNLGLITADSGSSQLLPSPGMDVTGMSPCVSYTCATQKRFKKPTRGVSTHF